MSRRTERIASVIRNIVADAIQNRLSDPRIERFTSVTRVAVVSDLALAHVHVSVMADEPQRKLCLAALQSAAGRLRALVAKGLSARQVPRLVFHLDDSLRGSIETVQLIDRLMEELGERPPWAEDEDKATHSPASDAPAGEASPAVLSAPDGAAPDRASAASRESRPEDT